MNLPTDSWDELVTHMIEARLDTTTLRAWEQHATTTEIRLLTLTEKRCQILERIEARAKEKGITSRVELNKQKMQVHKKQTALINVTTAGKLPMSCDYLLYHCEKFLQR